jgi:hypothetical protein
MGWTAGSLRPLVITPLAVMVLPLARPAVLAGSALASALQATVRGTVPSGRLFIVATADHHFGTSAPEFPPKRTNRIPCTGRRSAPPDNPFRADETPAQPRTRQENQCQQK